MLLNTNHVRVFFLQSPPCLLAGEGSLQLTLGFTARYALQRFFASLRMTVWKAFQQLGGRLATTDN
jgi:hypothetical protein